MEITLKAGKLRRKKFKLNKNTADMVNEVSSRYGIPVEELLRMAIMGEKIKVGNEKHLKKLRNDIDELLSEMFELEGQWASIRYRSHTFVKENRGLAIVLSGELAENKSLRNLMGKKRAHDDIREVVDYYLWL